MERATRFVISGNLSVATLKDFAYLYFFLDYAFLGEGRGKEEAKSTADRILSKPEYRKCKNEITREAPRCMLRDLSGGGRIKLISVRYERDSSKVVLEPGNFLKSTRNSVCIQLY